MLAGRKFRSWVAPFVLTGSAVVLASCKDAAAPEPEPEVVTMRLTVGAQSANVNVNTGVCTGCPLVLSNGATITAVFLAADGNPDPIAVAGDFRLSVTIPTNSAGLTFTLNQANQFSGTFNRTSAAATPFNVSFGLFHIEEAHTEFDQNVAVIVQ